MPRYLALIYGSENAWEALGEEEREARMQRYVAIAQRPEVVDGAELEPTSTATSVRVRNDETLVTDGPYAELKEALGGYYIFECDTIEQACELAALIPAAEDGAVEIRPAYVDEQAAQEAERHEVPA